MTPRRLGPLSRSAARLCRRGRRVVWTARRCSPTSSAVAAIPAVVHEVTKQVDNGPIVSTLYYQLTNDRIRQLPTSDGTQYTQKIHAFKNFKWERHGMFYAINLYHPAASAAGTNFHHMRLSPQTKVNPPFLKELFRAVLPKKTEQPAAEEAKAAGGAAGKK